MKESPRGHRGTGPKKCAGGVVDQKLQRAAPRRAGKRRRDRRESRNELRHQQRLHPPPLEIRLGIPHAGIGRERDAAEQTQNAIAVAPPEHEPDVVGDERRDERADHHVRRRNLVVARQRAGDEQRRHGRNRRADLLCENVQRDERDAVADADPLDRSDVVHGNRLPTT